MNNNRRWLRVVMCMLSAFVVAFAYTLRGIVEQIQMEQVLPTIYGIALVIGGLSFVLAMYYSYLVLKKRSNDSKILGTSLNKSVTFFFKIAQACSIGFKSGE